MEIIFSSMRIKRISFWFLNILKISEFENVEMIYDLID